MAFTTSGPAEAVPARPWPAERVEFWSIERPIPYGANARLHSDVDIDKIVASIVNWGWTNPVLVDEHGVLIAGHLRVAAAARLGLKSIPVLVARGWSEDEKQAYRLADNELAARGRWDPDLPCSELQNLKFSGRFAFMAWVWLSIIVALVGAQLNAEMEHQSTSGPPKPVGARGAQVADTIGPAQT